MTSDPSAPVQLEEQELAVARGGFISPETGHPEQTRPFFLDPDANEYTAPVIPTGEPKKRPGQTPDFPPPFLFPVA